MERIGLVFKAEKEVARSGKDVFRLGIRGADGQEYTYTLFEEGMIQMARSLKNNHAKIVINKKEGSKFWDIESIEAAPETAVKSDKDRSESLDRRITELANLKSACMLVGNMCPQITDVEKDASIVMKAAHLAVMVSGVFNSHIIRPTPVMQDYQDEEEELFSEVEQQSTKPKPKPKAVKGGEKVNIFADACLAAGYDVQTRPEEIIDWLDKNYSVRRFPDLIDEKQDLAISMMQEKDLAKE